MGYFASNAGKMLFSTCYFQAANPEGTFGSRRSRSGLLVFPLLLWQQQLFSSSAVCLLLGFSSKGTKSLIIVINESIERVAVATETVEQAQEDVRLAEERYRVGAGTMLETIAAQVSLTQAKADVIRGKCDYLVAVADLDRATGRESRLRAGQEGN